MIANFNDVMDVIKYDFKLQCTPPPQAVGGPHTIDAAVPTDIATVRYNP